MIYSPRYISNANYITVLKSLQKNLTLNFSDFKIFNPYNIWPYQYPNIWSTQSSCHFGSIWLFSSSFCRELKVGNRKRLRTLQTCVQVQRHYGQVLFWACLGLFAVRILHFYFHYTQQPHAQLLPPQYREPKQPPCVVISLDVASGVVGYLKSTDGLERSSFFRY